MGPHGHVIAHGSFQQKLSIENQSVNVAFWSRADGRRALAANSIGSLLMSANRVDAP